ncbi:DUF2946 family protein [Ramlibacter sp.]|uniref:DUF2946 family protein n=1 Tax=Ramlibacter sp. TaxID=1917967 RepID=UPI002D79075D|nr:hypothetical protein [Ramlibacter sp.]
MHALRHARPFGRFLAAWLLLWFVSMPVAMQSASAQVATGPLHGNPTACTAHAGHASPDCASDAGHRHASEADDEAALSHCPLCLHAAAPPPSQPVLRQAHVAPIERAGANLDAPPCLRTGAPLPARGPPALS